MKIKLIRSVMLVLLFLAGLLFVAHFAGPLILRRYIETGIGTSKQIPILCKSPSAEILHRQVNKEYRSQLLPYQLPGMLGYFPKGFNITLEVYKRDFYKKHKTLAQASAIYLLREDKDFFLNLFPILKKQGIADDYDFINHTLCARLNTIISLQDAFFVIMKSIFIPDLGDQAKVTLSRFAVENMSGFISYNTTGDVNYFDAIFFNRAGTFFRVYIKDKEKELDLDKAFTIISTLREKK